MKDNKIELKRFLNRIRRGDVIVMQFPADPQLLTLPSVYAIILNLITQSFFCIPHYASHKKRHVVLVAFFSLYFYIIFLCAVISQYDLSRGNRLIAWQLEAGLN